MTRRIGIIGLDTSHAESLVKFCQSGNEARVVAAWPGGSPDAPLSIGRVEGITATLRDHYGVQICCSPEAVAESCDALALLAMDGRTHPALFARIAPFGRPIFVNKPLAVDRAGAEAIAASGLRTKARWFSASGLRYSVPAARRAVTAQATCPLWFEPANAGWYWYGIHGVEMIYAAMGPGVAAVRVEAQDSCEKLWLRWKDGRMGRVVGVLAKDAPYGLACDGGEMQPISASMAHLERLILDFFGGADAPVGTAEMIEVMACLEAANTSRQAGGREIILPL